MTRAWAILAVGLSAWVQSRTAQDLRPQLEQLEKKADLGQLIAYARMCGVTPPWSK